MWQISVIVPIYGVEPYIHRCIDSILAQSFRDFELILVDDGSPDRCGEICDEYARTDTRIHVIHQPNGGLSAARNAGIDWACTNSDSQWLTFVDSDDYLHPCMLETLLYAGESHNVPISICSYIETHGETLDDIKDMSVSIWTPEALFREHCVTATIACAKLYRKDCFKEIRYPVGKVHEDEYITYRILFAQKEVAFVDAPLYGYFINPDGITKSGWHPGRMDAFDALEQQIAYFYENGYEDLAEWRAMGYLWNILRQIQMIQELPDKESTKQYLRMCRSKLCEAIKEHKKALQLNLIDHYLFFATARPYLTLWYRCLRKSQVLLGWQKKEEEPL